MKKVGEYFSNPFVVYISHVDAIMTAESHLDSSHESAHEIPMISPTVAYTSVIHVWLPMTEILIISLGFSLVRGSRI